MLGRFTADALNSGQVLGIAANSLAIDLRQPFLNVADPVQDGRPAEQFIDDAIIAEPVHGVTVEFFVDGEPRSFILISDTVILGRASTGLAGSAKRAPETLLGTLVHELTHARNLVQSDELGRTADTDSDVFVDTSLAQARTALTDIPTAAGMRSFVEEVVARHVHWIVLRELHSRVPLRCFNWEPAISPPRPTSTSSTGEERGISMTTDENYSPRAMRPSSRNLPRSCAGVPHSPSAPTSTRTMLPPRHSCPLRSSVTTKPPFPPAYRIPTAAFHSSRTSRPYALSLERALTLGRPDIVDAERIVQDQDFAILHTDLAVLEVLEESRRLLVDQLVEDREPQ